MPIIVISRPGSGLELVHVRSRPVQRLQPRNGTRRLYCIHHPESPPPGPLNEIQTTSTTLDSMKTFLESLYNTTRKMDPGPSSTNLDATASRLVDLLENCRPKKYATTHLWPSVLLRPAWLPTSRPDWRTVGVPKGLPLEQSEVYIEDPKSVDMLEFSTDPGTMNVVEFLNRLDTEGSEAERPWMGKFLESLRSALEGFMPDQHVVYFRAAKEISGDQLSNQSEDPMMEANASAALFSSTRLLRHP